MINGQLTLTEWAGCIDWWAVIILALLVTVLVLLVVFGPIKKDPITSVILLLAFAGIVIGLAGLYPDPMDFLVFWDNGACAN